MKSRETQVGPLIVSGRAASGFIIVEPMTRCWIASGFPTAMHAANAAKEMNEIADWLGVLKVRAEGGRPNCQGELERIALSFGGKLARSSTAMAEQICASVVARAEATL